MSSYKQISANRENAQLSTGPKSVEGKVISSNNSRKHGFFSAELHLALDEYSEFESLSAGLKDSLKPLGEFETLLVDKLAMIAWKTKQLYRMEQEYMGRHDFYCESKVDKLALPSFEKLLRYNSHLERMFYKCLSELQKVQEIRKTMITSNT